MTSRMEGKWPRRGGEKRDVTETGKLERWEKGKKYSARRERSFEGYVWFMI